MKGREERQKRIGRKKKDEKVRKMKTEIKKGIKS